MPSISLDGLTTLKRDENFYLWLALRLAIQGTGDEEVEEQGAGGQRGQGELLKKFLPYLPPLPCLPCLFTCPMPYAHLPFVNRCISNFVQTVVNLGRTENPVFC